MGWGGAIMMARSVGAGPGGAGGWGGQGVMHVSMVEPDLIRYFPLARRVAGGGRVGGSAGRHTTHQLVSQQPIRLALLLLVVCEIVVVVLAHGLVRVVVQASAAEELGDGGAALLEVEQEGNADADEEDEQNHHDVERDAGDGHGPRR